VKANAIIVVSIIPNSINVDQLFDERSFLVQVLKYQKPKLALLPKEEIPKTHDKWKKIFDAFFRRTFPFLNIFKIEEFVMCLPDTLATAEHIFSMIGSIWMNGRGRLSFSKENYLI